MREELVLQVALLRDHILCRADETVNQVLVAVQPARDLSIGPTKSNIILVLDDSGSMSGQPLSHVLEATRSIIQHLGPHDQLGIVGFADDAEVVHPIVGRGQRDSLLRVTDPFVWSHGRRGYGTNMALGLQRGAEELRRHSDPQRINRMIVLTDGFASNPEQTLELAQSLASERMSLVCLGFGGEFDMHFMDRIASFSGGACEYIDPRQMGSAVAHFLDHLTSIQNQLTDNTRVKLTFRGQHRITDFFQTHPKVIYHGPAHLGPERTWEHRLAPIEREKGLEILFSVVHGADVAGRKLVAEVEVTYDLPAASLFNQTLKREVVVEYGDDERAFMRVDPRVQRRYNDAYVERQRTRADQLIQAGQTDVAYKVLGTIKKRGNDQVKALAEGTIKKLQESGKVDSEQLFKLKMGTQKKAAVPSESSSTSGLSSSQLSAGDTSTEEGAS